MVRLGALSSGVLFGTPLAQLKHYNRRPKVCVLHEFIAVNRDEIISRCRAKVSARSIPPPAEGGLEHGVPVFLDQLGHALRLAATARTELYCERPGAPFAIARHPVTSWSESGARGNDLRAGGRTP